MSNDHILCVGCEEYVKYEHTDLPWHGCEQRKGGALCLDCMAIGIVQGHIAEFAQRNVYTIKDYFPPIQNAHNIFMHWDKKIQCLECCQTYSPDLNVTQIGWLLDSVAAECKILETSLLQFLLEMLQDKNEIITSLNRSLHEMEKLVEFQNNLIKSYTNKKD